MIIPEVYKNEWSLFLDRDGVINKRIIDGYVQKPSQFEFIKGSLEAIKQLSSLFKYIFIITNQQGIGKGLMTESELEIIHNHMLNQINQSDGRIDGIYFCPDLASKSPNCRKPGLFMAEAAKKDFPEIDFKKSIMVGDSLIDMEFGRNAGMQCIYIQSNSIEKIIEFDSPIFTSLLQFSKSLKTK